MKRHRMVLTSVFLRGGFLTLCILLGVVSTQVFRSEVSVAQQVGRSEGTFTGQVIAWRELTLIKGVTPEDFERFVAEEFTPAFEEYVPGVRSYILKGQRGDRKGAYARLMLFDSATTRDFYFPTEGEGDASVPAEAQKALAARPGGGLRRPCAICGVNPRNGGLHRLYDRAATVTAAEQ